MLSERQVREAIAYAVQNIDAFALPANADFGDSGLDSLDQASILLAIKDKHGVDFSDDVGLSLTTIQSIVEYAASVSH
jgi:acyl carrier protein